MKAVDGGDEQYGSQANPDGELQADYIDTDLWVYVPVQIKRGIRNTRDICIPDKKTQGRKHKAMQIMPPLLHALPLFPSLITGNNLTLNSEPVILLHALNVNVPESSHWSQDSTTPALFIWESVEVECERETGFRNHPSGAEVAGVTVGLDDRLDFC